MTHSNPLSNVYAFVWLFHYSPICPPCISLTLISKHGLLEVEWFHFKDQPKERANRNHFSKSEGLAEDDTILCFTHCIEAGYPSAWFYTHHGQYNIETDTLSSKEFWIFKLFVKDDGKTFQSAMDLLNDKLTCIRAHVSQPL